MFLVHHEDLAVTLHKVVATSHTHSYQHAAWRRSCRLLHSGSGPGFPRQSGGPQDIPRTVRYCQGLLVLPPGLRPIEDKQAHLQLPPDPPRLLHP